MTPVRTADMHHVAAQAALAVPGVAGLQPTLKHRLAGAATRMQQALGIDTLPAEAGIRAEELPDAPGWRVEVRCILHDDRRALDTAREVRRHVRSAVTGHLARQGMPGPVAVQVTVTQTVGRTP
ncbi:hypothetical protein ABT112_23690 [Streptomyces sp. NPDC002055]|uniref:hypothetical protein n=1 Tax=Streptomyces sp. NPDC002055 TaxID=3154534 RepID=UPI0033283D5A